jgi:tetratricopeptide (TPR) repeat protein
VLILDEALQETTPALLALLDALPADSPFLTLDPLQRRQRTLEGLKRVLLRESQEQPLVVVFEDLHWIDAETQALLGDNASLAPLKQLLIVRTVGNPFFLEESVRTLVEMGVLVGELGAYRLAQPVDSLQIPATVQAVLAARIDRLPPEAKRRLQTAAVIGGVVSLRQGNFQKAIPVLERGLQVCQATHLRLFFPRLASTLSLAYMQSGRLAAGLSLLEQAVEQSAAMQIVLLHALWLIHLGEGYRLTGRPQEATQCALRALELARTHQERGHQAYALRLFGDIAAHREPPEVEAAETHYRQALALAEELGMRPLLAHCHLGLGTIYAQIGQREQACAALTTAIDLYRAMDMRFWLPQAEAVLARVEG